MEYKTENIKFETRCVRVFWNNIQQPGAVFNDAREALEYIRKTGGYRGYAVKYPGGEISDLEIREDINNRLQEIEQANSIKTI